MYGAQRGWIKLDSGSPATSQVPGTSAPTAVSDEQIAALVAESTPLAGPTMVPPAVAAAEIAGAGSPIWRTGVKIDAMWMIDETRNAWARIVGVGWRKLYNGP